MKQSDTVLGYSFLIQAANIDACPGNCIRPVGLAFAKDNRLYVTSDSSGEVNFFQAGNHLHCLT